MVSHSSLRLTSLMISRCKERLRIRLSRPHLPLLVRLGPLTRFAPFRTRSRQDVSPSSSCSASIPRLRLLGALCFRTVEQGREVEAQTCFLYCSPGGTRLGKVDSVMRSPGGPPVGGSAVDMQGHWKPGRGGYVKGLISFEIFPPTFYAGLSGVQGCSRAGPGASSRRGESMGEALGGVRTGRSVAGMAAKAEVEVLSCRARLEPGTQPSEEGNHRIFNLPEKDYIPGCNFLQTSLKILVSRKGKLSRERLEPYLLIKRYLRTEHSVSRIRGSFYDRGRGKGGGFSIFMPESQNNRCMPSLEPSSCLDHRSWNRAVVVNSDSSWNYDELAEKGTPWVKSEN
nr:hypothetical protein Iba_chr12aCG19670 [Ipomoea batatas]